MATDAIEGAASDEEVPTEIPITTRNRAKTPNSEIDLHPILLYHYFLFLNV